MRKSFKKLLLRGVLVFSFLAAFFVFSSAFAMKPRSQSADYVSKLAKGGGKCCKVTYPAGFYTLGNLESQYQEFFESKNYGGKALVKKLLDRPRHFKIVFQSIYGKSIEFEVKFSLCLPGEFEKEAEKYNEIVRFAKNHGFSGSDQIDFVDPASREEIEAQVASKDAKGTKLYDFVVCKRYGLSVPDYSDSDSDSDSTDDDSLYGCISEGGIKIPESLKTTGQNRFWAWK